MEHSHDTALRRSIDRERQQIAKLKAKKKALAVKMHALRTKIRRAEKQREEQRQQVMGRYVAAMMAESEQVRQLLCRGLDGYLTRDAERALFDLAPLPKAEECQGTEQPPALVP